MRNFFNRFKRQLIIFLIVAGPGFITAFADNDAGGVATYSVAAAKYGYQILIILIPITLVLAVTQEVGARITLATGKGLADLIRERFGIMTTLFIFGLTSLVNFGVILQDISGLKSALQLFNINYYIFLPILLALLILFLIKSSYSKTEKLLFFVMLFYLTYFFSAVMAKPDWGFVAKSLFIPKGKISFDFIFTSIAVLGTTVTLWGQFVISSSIKDKKITTAKMKFQQIEIYLASILSNVFTLFMMVAVAATLFINKITISGAAEAALAIKPLAGNLAGTFFGIGLLAAGFLGCVIVPLSTAYAFSEFFGYKGSLNDNFKKSRFFYIFFLVQIIIGAMIVMQPKFSLFQFTLFADFINGISLPVIFYFLYKFANDRELMDKFKNNRAQNFLIIISAVLIIIGSLIGIVGKIFKF